MGPTKQRAPRPLDLGDPIARLGSVGVRSTARLAKLGIRTVRHLLWHLPARYEDYSATVPIAQVVAGQKQSIQGCVVAVGSRNIWPRRLTVTTATISDDSGAIRAVWFNQPYLAQALSEGTRVSLAGKVVLDKRGLYLASPIYEKIQPSPESGTEGTSLRHTGRLIPIYPETDGITSKYLRYLIQPLLEQLPFADTLPIAVRRQHKLIGLAQALKAIHYPEHLDDVAVARERLAFDDLLLLQLQALQTRRLFSRRRSARIVMDAPYVKRLIAGLPFTLTRDQRVALLEILRDMERGYPMNRLLEGDVGSGKTVVALLAAMHAAKENRRTILLVPTEVLAQQHHQVAQQLFPAGVGRTIGLLTGAFAAIGKRTVTKNIAKKAIATGAVDILIGTHALLEDDIRFPQLALVVIDEQHRFGIAQRSSLVQPAKKSGDLVPHLLSMTATPIPRTLALTVFGDLDISILKEKPKGRQPVETRVVAGSRRRDMEGFIREQAVAGRQIFIICPAIELMSSEPASVHRGPRQQRFNELWAQVKAVENEYRRLSTVVFPDLRIAMLHGKMKPKEKQRVMQEFKDGWHDILVCTSIIEVGVDIPNTTVLVVEGAERFGLAQLHQFRGRIGRGQHASFCFLLPTDDSVGVSRRLQAMVKTNDGFALAEADMRIRGPGEFFGVKQSGIPDLTMAALANVELIKKARLTARALLREDPQLRQYPSLKQQLDVFQRLSHTE